MSKRLLSFLLLSCLLWTLVPAQAADTQKDNASDMESVQEDLFYGYMKKLAGADVAPPSDVAGSRADAVSFAGRAPGRDAVDDYAASAAGSKLTGLTRKVYDLLKAEIVKIAAGERTNTSITLNGKDLGIEGLSWSCAELGLTSAEAMEEWAKGDPEYKILYQILKKLGGVSGSELMGSV